MHLLGRELTLQDLRKHRHLVIRDTGSQRRSGSWLGAEQSWTVSHKATSIHAAALGLGFAWFAEDMVRDELKRGVAQAAAAARGRRTLGRRSTWCSPIAITRAPARCGWRKSSVNTCPINAANWATSAIKRNQHESLPSRRGADRDSRRMRILAGGARRPGAPGDIAGSSADLPAATGIPLRADRKSCRVQPWILRDHGGRKMDKVVERLKQQAAKLGANGILLHGVADQAGSPVGAAVDVENQSSRSPYGLGFSAWAFFYSKAGDGVAIYVEPK